MRGPGRISAGTSHCKPDPSVDCRLLGAGSPQNAARGGGAAARRRRHWCCLGRRRSDAQIGHRIEPTARPSHEGRARPGPRSARRAVARSRPSTRAEPPVHSRKQQQSPRGTRPRGIGVGAPWGAPSAVGRCSQTSTRPSQRSETVSMRAYQSDWRMLWGLAAAAVGRRCGWAARHRPAPPPHALRSHARRKHGKLRHDRGHRCHTLQRGRHR